MNSTALIDARIIRLRTFTNEVRRLMYSKAVDEGFYDSRRIEAYVEGMFNYLYAHEEEWSFVQLLSMMNDDSFVVSAWNNMLR